MSWIVAYSILIFAIGIYALLLSISNVHVLSKQIPHKLTDNGPLISILIPARNEESNLPACIESLQKQAYRNIEILVLDDNSTDRTWDVIQTHALEDPRVHGIKGQPLPSGWKGKLFAMQQLFENAKGEYLLFTDADTVHAQQSVAFGYSVATKNNAALVSGYPREICPSWGVGSIISAMLFNTVLFVPLALQRSYPKSIFAMAIGQYLFIKRSALEDIQGFTRFRNTITDDVHLARELVKQGHRQLLVDASSAVSCTMYATTKEAFGGIERSIVGVVPMKLFPLIMLAVVVLLCCGLAPAAMTACIIAGAMGYVGFVVPAILTTIGTVLLYGIWAVMALFHGYPVSVALTGCVTFFWICGMYIHGLFRTFTKKGFSWKGRTI